MTSSTAAQRLLRQEVCLSQRPPSATKAFGGLRAVEEVSFGVTAGEIIVGVIGPNDIDKSTLFNLITGLAQFERSRSGDSAS
jgi:ABC-type branched-subunit amino acid transport system ATPase component